MESSNRDGPGIGEGGMAQRGITYLVWHDLVGLSRTRGVPTATLHARMALGLGWACAGQALTAFEDIVDNPWGPVEEVRQIPDPKAHFTIPENGDHPAVAFFLSDSLRDDLAPWSCCTRSFLRSALDDFRAETGLDITASFEHEFLLFGEGISPATPFSFAAARTQHGFLSALEETMGMMGLGLSSIEPEFGLGQYEIALDPAAALRAADECVVARETIREVARRCGLQASLTAKPAEDAVGNGAHLHLSLTDEAGANATHDAGGALQLSPQAQSFCAGILDHIDALVAFSAPTPVSYYRLGPHHWSCGFRAIGLQNREAALRVVPGVGDAGARQRGHHIEYRPIDDTCSPYLALAMLIRAGLDGIRRALPLPDPVEGDPADLSEADRAAMGITPLPSTLDAALGAVVADKTLMGWMEPDLSSTYLALKRWEVEFAADNSPATVFERYRSAY